MLRASADNHQCPFFHKFYPIDKSVSNDHLVRWASVAHVLSEEDLVPPATQVHLRYHLGVAAPGNVSDFGLVDLLTLVDQFRRHLGNKFTVLIEPYFGRRGVTVQNHLVLPWLQSWPAGNSPRFKQIDIG